MADSTIIVSSGSTLSGQGVTGSNSILILSGGTGSHLTAGFSAPGGTIAVQGTDSHATLYYEGTEEILSGGIATSTTITNVGASQFVESGGTAARTADGGAQFVESGGKATSTTVGSGGGEVISAGGVASGTTVDSGGVAVVLPGGSLKSVTVENGGVVMSTGIAVYDPRSGFTSETKAEAKALAISGGSIEYILQTGDARKTVITSGGTQLVFSGGTAETTKISAGGVETVLAGGSALSTTIASGGTEIVSGGTTDQTVIAGGTLELAGGVASNSIDFSKKNGTLDIASGSSVPSNAFIEGFAKGDKIDFSFLTSSAGDSYSVENDAVVISAGGQTYTLEIVGATPGGYALSAGADGSLVFAVCYFPGTLIRTASGDVAVERLAIGNEVVTAEGRVMPIRWIGRNTVSLRFADPLRVLPIRIRAGALGENLPERDLLVSPEHAVLVEDILVHAAALVNGLSILRERDVPDVFTYYHVELAEHALILAEGTPAESFVDNIHRTAFDNWEEHEALYGDAPIVELPQPRALSYRQVPAEIHGRLMARARLLFADAAQRVA